MPATCTCCGETVEGSVHLHSRRDIAICYGCLDWLNGRRDRQVAAQGGGWRVVGSDPIFTVAGVARSVDHYQRLGFEISHHDATYAFAHRDGDLTIHLAQGQAGAPPRLGSLYLHVDDAEQVAEEWRKAGL